VNGNNNADVTVTMLTGLMQFDRQRYRRPVPVQSVAGPDVNYYVNALDELRVWNSGGSKLGNGEFWAHQFV